MTVYRLTRESIDELPRTSFAKHSIFERGDLQRLLRANFSVIAPDVLIISEEFSDWEDSRRRIDLLGIDRDAAMVVIELKRSDVGGHMDLQAIRYAAMVSSITFSRAVSTYQAYLDRVEPGCDAREKILDFLEWSEPHEEDFANDVRIVLVAADFSKELTTSVLWLNERDLDIRCVRLKPYELDVEIILDVQQVVPLPEAQEYVVRLREKAMEQREAVREDTGYWFMNTGEGTDDSRSWDDCRKYGFLMAGGGKKYIDHAKRLQPGDRVLAYVNRHGYVGEGEVLKNAVPFMEFVPEGKSKPLADLALQAKVNMDRMKNPETADWCVAVRWHLAVDKERAVLQERARRSTLERIRQPDLVAQVRQELEKLTLRSTEL